MQNLIYTIKPVEELTFADSPMFQAVMKNPKICKKVIEMLLHIKIDHIEYPELEKNIQPLFTQRGIRFDVYVKDENRIFDVEIQNYEDRDYAKRTRYYQSMLDSDQLSKGTDYSNLKENYIIFICKKDPFNLGLSCYTFSNMCHENQQLELNDKTMKVFYNIEAFNNEKDKEIYLFLKRLAGHEVMSDLINEIESEVKVQKFKVSFINEYMARALAERDLRVYATREGMKEGIKKGRSESKLEDAIIAVTKYKLSPEEISKDFNVPLEELQAALHNL